MVGNDGKGGRSQDSILSKNLSGGVVKLEGRPKPFSGSGRIARVWHSGLAEAGRARMVFRARLVWSAPNPGREGAARPTRSTSGSGAREDISLLTRLNLLLEKVAELGAPGDVAGVVVRRVEVLVPRRLGQRNLAAEGRHGSWLGRARGRGKVEGLERHSAQQKVTLRGDC